MSSSSVPVEPKRQSRKFRGLLVLAMVVGYPVFCWWFIVRGGSVGETALWVAGSFQLVCYVGLLWLFGSSFWLHEEPIITRLARFVHGGLSVEVERYTRRLTLFWSLFFAAMVIVSLLLLGLVSPKAWLYFANVINLPLLATVFISEYLYRVSRFPDTPSILETIQAFRKYRGERGNGRASQQKMNAARDLKSHHRDA